MTPCVVFRSAITTTARAVPSLVLKIFREKSSTRLAFWFAALNSFLDDERPQDVLAVDPDRVISAAKDETAGVQHG